MTIYRAVLRKNFDAAKLCVPHPTRRMPSNVPFVADNVWEWLRPAHMPSRRYAVYASPTPALAIANASAGLDAPDKYVVCEVDFAVGKFVVVQLAIPDARTHQDISLILKTVPADALLAEKLKCATIYLPCVDKADLNAFFSAPEHASLAAKLRAECTFWTDLSEQVDPESNGEMFFEVPAQGHYRLTPVPSPPAS